MNPIAISLGLILAGALAAMAYYHSKIKTLTINIIDEFGKLSLKGDFVATGQTSPPGGGIIGMLRFVNDRIQSLKKTVDQPVQAKPVQAPAGSNEIAELKKKNEDLKVVNELGQHVTSSLKLEDTFQHLYETINSMMDAAVLEMGIYNWRDNRWKILSNNPAIAASTDYHNHFAEWSLKNHREIFLGNAIKDYQRYVFKPLTLPDGSNPVSVMTFPVYRNHQEVGAISVFSYHENAFSDYHRDIIHSLIPYTAVAIGNALIHQELIETQDQLIHNEKMASLGQIASGIAHEILNPLNFVNNFSELSMELVPEIDNTQSKEEQAELKGQLLNNLDKIHLHGQRAYSIVKNMLLLSRRNGKGNKIDIKIDQAIEEFLDIGYTGFRNKFPDFSCKIVTEFGDNGMSYEIIPEDFGSVILNLSSNAFYTLNEKMKKLSSLGEASGLVSYEPTLTIKTSTSGGMLKIEVIDNGLGIPEEIQDKIFLPFFTTKPPGEGTGLGLSISHDIVFKGHKGDLSVVSTINKGSSFTISLPLNVN